MMMPATDGFELCTSKNDIRLLTPVILSRPRKDADKITPNPRRRHLIKPQFTGTTNKGTQPD